MAEVEERLSLDITDALASVSALEAALTGSVDGFQSAMDAAVAALTGQLESLSSTEIAVAVDGDTSQLEAEVGQVAADPVVVDVDADTSAAEAALDALAGSASDLTESLGDVATATPKAGSGFEAAGTSATILSAGLASAARGGQSLGGVLQGITSKAGPVGISIAGVVTAVGTLGVGAIDADTAARRLDSSLGDLASNINNLAIDGLGEDLSAIAIAAASDDDALRLFAAGVADLGAASGKTRDESAALAETLLTMAAKLAVLRPELGSAETIADGLTRALARGGRSLTQFGLAAPTKEIAAMAEGFAGAGNEVTQFDMIAAGASLAAGQLTDDAAELAEAAAAPSLGFRRLNVELGETLEAAGSEILPELVKIIEDLTPAVVDLAEGFGDLAAAAAKPLSVVTGVVSKGVGVFSNLVDAAQDTGGAIRSVFDSTDFGDAVGNVTTWGNAADRSLRGVGRAAGTVSDPLARLGVDAADTAREMDELARAATDADRAIGDQLGATLDEFAAGEAARDATFALDAAMRDATQAAQDVDRAVREYGSGSEQATEKQFALAAAIEAQRDAAIRSAEATADLRIKQLLLENPLATNADKARIQAEEFRKLARSTTDSGLAGILEGLATRLDAVARLRPSTVVDIQTAEAERRIANLKSALLGGLPRSSIEQSWEELFRRAANAVQPTPKAHGGPFHANQLLLVGEQGPELVRFNSGGTVINNTDSRALAGSGSTINVYEVGGDPYATAFAVGTELGKASTR